MREGITKVILAAIVGCAMYLGAINILAEKPEGITDIPTGDLLMASASPNDKYVLKTYLCDGGATVDYAVRGEIENEEGDLKNIYWDYHTKKSDIEWISDEIVKINGVKINFLDEVYDYRSI